MTDRRTKALWPLVTVAILLTITVGYFGGFYLTGTTVSDERVHTFRAEWQIALFTPAAEVECWALGCKVRMVLRTD